MKKIRAYMAGEDLEKAVIEMVNLMYQNRTAGNFYSAFFSVLYEEAERRGLTELWLKQKS